VQAYEGAQRCKLALRTAHAETGLTGATPHLVMASWSGALLLDIVDVSPRVRRSAAALPYTHEEREGEYTAGK